MLLVAGCASRAEPPAPSPLASSTATPAATATSLASAASSAAAPAPVRLAPPPVFFADKSSDAWVDETFKVQGVYERVLVVSDKPAPATVHVPALNLVTGKDGPPSELPVKASFTTIQSAIDASKPGELVVVLPGHYAGFSVGPKEGAGDHAYLHVRALGPPGSVVVDAPSSQDSHWMIAIVGGAHHVILQGFTVVGNANGPWGGVYLSGDFPKTGELVHHVAITSVTALDHAKWGFHSVDTRVVLLQDSFFAHSHEEHGAYVSDGSDEYVIRRNVFFENDDCGLQINLDPKASLNKVTKHPKLADLPRKGTSRAWALEVLRRANEAFGEGNYPDGRGERFLVEDNVMNRNGKGGGGALNLAGLRGAVIQNNLIYGNEAHGVAMWDNENTYDEELIKGPAKGATKDPNELPIFGCAGNLLRNNTVVMSKDGRDALLAIHGSYGLRAFNNVLVNDKKSTLELDATSLPGLELRSNVFGARVDENGASAEAKALAILGVGTSDNTWNATPASVAAAVRSKLDEPWVTITKTTWALNPKRPDFRPARSGPLAGHGLARECPPRDLTGAARQGADIGALSSTP